MKIVDKITVDELQTMSKAMYDGLVKAVVDVKKKIVAVDAEMHYDEEQLLLENGSQQGDLWGVNLYPSEYGKESFIEYNSMIKIRPNHNNRSRGVDDGAMRKEIEQIISEVVHA